MAYILPDPKLEQPFLLTPGRKPNGPVVVDWQHPLARELKMCVLITKDTDLARPGVKGTYGGNSAYTLAPNGKGMAWYDNSGNSHDTVTYLRPFDQEETNYTYLVECYFLDTGASGDSSVIQYADGTGTGRGVIFWDEGNTTSGPMATYIGGSLRQGTSTLTAGNWYTLGLVKTGVNVEFFVNGISDGTGSYTGINAANGLLHIGGHKTLGNASMDGYITYVYAWQRALKDHEVASVSRHPYQFLIPA